jgi:uroporphyrinogen-III synthase
MPNRLSGVKVLVTRQRDRQSQLAELLDAEGAVVITAPAIEVHPVDQEELRQGLTALGRAAWVVFTSVNGVESIAAEWPHHDFRGRIATVGPATANAVHRLLGIRSEHAAKYHADALVQRFASEFSGRVLLIRGDRADTRVRDSILARNLELADVIAYRTVWVEWDTLPEEPDLFAFASASAVHSTHQNLARLESADWLRFKPKAAMGPTTANALRELGYEGSVSAQDSTLVGLLGAIVSASGRSAS